MGHCRHCLNFPYGTPAGRGEGAGIFKFAERVFLKKKKRKKPRLKLFEQAVRFSLFIGHGNQMVTYYLIIY